MTAFEFAFSLFGLLLGLCIAEVLGGLGRALEHREDVSIGWLTPTSAFDPLRTLQDACEKRPWRPE